MGILDAPGYNRTQAAATFAKAGYPTYLATNGVTPANRFDLSRSVYNWKNSNTKKLRASIDKAAAGSSLEHHVFIGDSETHCYAGSENATLDPRQMWPRRLRDLLVSAAGVTSGGEGIIRTGKANTTLPEPRWTYGTGWTKLTNYVQTSTSGSTATCVTAEACTAIDVYYLDSGTGSASITIDGANTKTFTAVNSGTVKKVSWTGLTSSTHTVVLTTTAAVAVNLVGVGAYNTAGLVFHNMAAFGTQATSEWNDTSTFFYYAHMTQMLYGGTGPKTSVTSGAVNAAAAPKVLHCQIGVNDIRTGLKTAAATVAAIQTVLGWWSASEIYIYAQVQPADVTQATWETYVAGLYGLADTLDVPLFDWHHRTISGAQALADGKLSSDNLHPTIPWQYEQARTIAALATA